ncbi:hypothetical protein CEXT_411661 [Caerostris extrusa]|uniref:Uncharacterized protein n=1 Tax=Caerostris extrusa TaxID=172846 RepID=A0AAV4M7E7_CAEEX|nr:hypothetical protein CEXT_411661 [Caerostris extrusa]
MCAENIPFSEHNSFILENLLPSYFGNPNSMFSYWLPLSPVIGRFAAHIPVTIFNQLSSVHSNFARSYMNSRLLKHCCVTIYCNRGYLFISHLIGYDFP